MESHHHAKAMTPYVIATPFPNCFQFSLLLHIAAAAALSLVQSFTQTSQPSFSSLCVSVCLSFSLCLCLDSSVCVCVSLSLSFAYECRGAAEIRRAENLSTVLCCNQIESCWKASSRTCSRRTLGSRAARFEPPRAALGDAERVAERPGVDRREGAPPTNPSRTAFLAHKPPPALLKQNPK